MAFSTCRFPSIYNASMQRGQWIIGKYCFPSHELDMACSANSDPESSSLSSVANYSSFNRKLIPPVRAGNKGYKAVVHCRSKLVRGMFIQGWVTERRKLERARISAWKLCVVAKALYYIYMDLHFHHASLSKVYDRYINRSNRSFSSNHIS